MPGEKDKQHRCWKNGTQKHPVVPGLEAEQVPDAFCKGRLSGNLLFAHLLADLKQALRPAAFIRRKTKALRGDVISDAVAADAGMPSAFFCLARFMILHKNPPCLIAGAVLQALAGSLI